METEKLKKALEDRGEPNYRFSQIYQAVFCDLIFDFDKITTIPKRLRDDLKKEVILFSLKEEKIQISKEVEKVLFKLHDDYFIETVLMKHDYEKKTLCISSQVGCPLGCKFCATGKMGFIRNLDWQEIVDQVLFFAQKENEKNLNIVFMGMGEPFLNYDNVLRAIRTLNDKEGFNLAARSMSVSTAGIIPGIKKLQEENLQVNLAVSLNSPDDKQRSEIMPVNNQYPLKDLIKTLKEYIKKTNRKVFLEYVMLKDINDDKKSLDKLIKLLKDEPLFHLNLIRYNDTNSEFMGPDKRTVETFKIQLNKNKIKTTIRHNFGDEIDAACGQLTTKYVKSKRS